MHVVLYKYLGEKNRVDKGSFLSLVLDTTGDFKASVSILNPTLLLKLPPQPKQSLEDENGDEIDEVQIDDGDAIRVLNFNYFYVEEFRRYYYLTSFIISSNQLATITGVVDPLYSFKDAIIENEAYIERNEFTYDANMDDPLFPVGSIYKETKTELDSGNLKNFSFKTDFIDQWDTWNIAVTIANKNGIIPIYPILYNAPSNTELPNIHIYAMGIYSSAVEVMNYVNFSRMEDGFLFNKSTVEDFIISAVIYPFELENDGYLDDFSIVVPDAGGSTKLVEFENTKAKHGKKFSRYLILCDFTIYPQDFRDLEPIAEYSLWIPFLGYKDINMRNLLNHHLILYYTCNYSDGSGKAVLYDDTAEKSIVSENVQLGANLPMTKTNAQQLRNSYDSIIVNGMLNAINSSISAASSYGKGDTMGTIGSAVSGIGGVLSAYMQTRQLYPSAHVTPSGSADGLYQPLKCHLRKIYKEGLADLSKFAHQYGRPLREIRKLNTLSGFTLISSIHLEGLDAFDAEKAEIESSLLSGVLL